MNIDPITSSEAVMRPNGRTAEAEFAMVPEIILGTTLMEVGKKFALTKSYEQFRYLYIMYSNLESLGCMQCMLLATRFIDGRKNLLSLHARISEASYAYSQIGFTNTTTLEASTATGSGTYPNMYVKICGIK